MRNGSSTSGCPRASEVGAGLVAVLATGWAGSAAAQPALLDVGPSETPATPESAAPPSAAPGIATLDQEALFIESRFGQRVQRELERDRAALASENRRIEQDLIEEERALTERRGALPPAEFSALAAAFDDKVQAIRSEQDLKARRLQEQLDRERQRFLSVVGPVLTDLLASRGAAVLIDSAAVLISTPGVDMTEAAIAAIDARLSDGSSQGLATPAPRPDAGSEPAPATP